MKKKNKIKTPALIPIEKHAANNTQAACWGFGFGWGFCFFVFKKREREKFLVAFSNFIFHWCSKGQCSKF